jgi:hypothetical protein
VVIRILVLPARNTTESPSVYGPYELVELVMAKVLEDHGGKRGRTVDETSRSVVGKSCDDRCHGRIGDHGQLAGSLELCSLV